MQQIEERSWKISVHARFNKFHFKFKARKTEPSWKFLKFSIFLRLHEFLLKVKSESGPIPGQQPRTLKSKFLKIFRKLKMPPAKKRTIASATGKMQGLQQPEDKFHADRLANFEYEEPDSIGSLLIGALALMSKSICEKQQQRIIIHGSCILLFLALFFKRHKTGKVMTLLVFFAIPTVVCALALRLQKYTNYCEDYISEIVWKAWNYAASSGCLYVFSQVIFSRFLQYVGVGTG